MGLLDQLWDDTVAGPRPENGLSKLRKYSSLNYRSSSGKGLPDSSLGARSDRELGRSYSDNLSVEPVKVTRSIMIVRPAGSPSAGSGSPPVSPASSPAGSTPPVSPFFDLGLSTKRLKWEISCFAWNAVKRYVWMGLLATGYMAMEIILF